jgi:hypothetical protein
MIQTDEELGHEAHYAFIDITLRSSKRSFNQQKRAYEAWLAKYIPLAEARGLTEQVLGMRRVVARWLLTEAAEANRPARVFEPLVRDIEELGWESLEKKVLWIGAMCSYFANRMWKREGLRYLLPLKKEVAEEYARTGEKTWANYLHDLRRIEERLRARSRSF